MAIGNRYYVRKHYSKQLDQVLRDLPDLLDALPERIARRRRDMGGKVYLNVGLERHNGPHRAAWHGVRIYSDGSWRPASHYGCRTDVIL